MKFAQECELCMENYVLVKKRNVYKWAKHEFITSSLSHKWRGKTLILRAQLLVKIKKLDDSLLGCEKTHDISLKKCNCKLFS